VSQLQNAGDVGEKRRGVEVRHVPPVYPIKDDIPVMLIDEATIEPD
jgi:hypothetical protein